jgi:hypothetical protein
MVEVAPRLKTRRLKEIQELLAEYQELGKSCLQTVCCMSSGM